MDTVNALRLRLGCGHYSKDDSCEECGRLGGLPDPWLVAGDDINLNRLSETRAYRQSKFANHLTRSGNGVRVST